jgi:hypothetical protein
LVCWEISTNPTTHYKTIMPARSVLQALALSHPRQPRASNIWRKDMQLQVFCWGCVINIWWAISLYFHVFQWLRRGFGLVNRFIGSSLVVLTVSSYSLKITVTITLVTSNTKSSNSSSGPIAVPLNLRNSSEINSHSRILSYHLGTDHTQKTQFYCGVAQITQKISNVIIISPVHWRTDCCLATWCKYSSYYCVTLSEVFIAPLPGNALTCQNIIIRKLIYSIFNI